MTRVRVEGFTISLDGYGAGPSQDIRNPLGVGGEELHQWLIPTRTFQRTSFGADGGTTGVDDDFAARGFKTAILAEDGFSKLLATGLTAVFAFQAFVIIGGVTRVIPLTGVTLPLVSYGGSSIVANFILLALLLLVSDRARRGAREVAP